MLISSLLERIKMSNLGVFRIVVASLDGVLAISLNFVNISPIREQISYTTC